VKPPEAESFVKPESFVHFHTKNGAKVKDFNDSSPFLRHTAWRSHNRPLVSVNGGGGGGGLDPPL